MNRKNTYSTPAAFRAALTDKLRERARTSKWTLPQLQRQMGYDRLLERLYLVDQGWIVKGATALLARDIGVRGSLDVDVYRAVAAEIAEQDLRRAAALDVGDWFRFELGGVVRGETVTTVPVSAFIGTTPWAQFHVDLVGADLRMTGQPDDVPPLASVMMPNVEQHGYRAYPLVDHVADKVAALYETHGPDRRPSTRYRDLVDLVAIVIATSVGAVAQQAALVSEFGRRGLVLPLQFGVPDRTLWEPGYRREVGRSLLPVAHTLDEALMVVRPFIDPLLNQTALGRWEPERGAWSDGSDGRSVER